MKDQVYGAVMLLMMKKNENKLQALAGLMKKYENITLADLKISKYFQFDEHFRATFTLNYDTFLSNAADSTRPGGSSIYSNASPFQQAITELEYIRYIPEPTGKLTHIYNLNWTIIAEIDKFWYGVSIDESHLAIDTDNLLGVYIFVILKSSFP